MQQRRGRRWVNLGVAIGVGALLAGCGSADALPRILGSAAGTNEARATADALQSSYLLPTFELASGVDLPAGEADAWRWPVTDAAAVADLAARLGVTGAPEEVPADLGGGWTVGGEDADLTLGVWAGGSWWMGSTRSATSISVCTTPAAPADATPSVDGAVVLGEPDCDPLGPPPALPTDEELLATARSVFGDGVELALTDRSEWWAGVSATYLVDGRPSGVTGSYSVGPGGPSAAGVLGTPERIGPYPTISAADALARLTATGGGSPMPLVGSVTSDAKVTVSSDGDVAVSSDDPVPGAVDGSDGAAGGGSSSPGFAGGAESPPSEPPLPSELEVPQPEPAPYPLPEPMPMPMPEVVPEVITLVAVEPTLVPFGDVDGVMWALPGYRFADGDGSTWDVVAVSDEFFGVVDPAEPGPVEPAPVDPAPGGVEPPVTAVPEPGTVDPGPSTTVVGGNGGEPIAEAELEALRGLFEEEAYLLLESRAAVVRVAVRDGVSLPVTRDYRADRVNLGIADGVVVEWWVG